MVSSLYSEHVLHINSYHIFFYLIFTENLLCKPCVSIHENSEKEFEKISLLSSSGSISWGIWKSYCIREWMCCHRLGERYRKNSGEEHLWTKSHASYFGSVLYLLFNISRIVNSLLLYDYSSPLKSETNLTSGSWKPSLCQTTTQKHVQQWAVASYLFSERHHTGSFTHIFPLDFRKARSMIDAFIRSLFYIVISNNLPNHC